MSKHKSEDYCRVLGISRERLRDEDEDAIESLVDKSFADAYMKELNSKNPDSAARMNLLIEAKKALKNPQKREEYLRGNLPQVEEKGEPVEHKLGALWDLADSVGKEYTGKVVRTTASGVDVEIRPGETCLVPISQMDDGSAGVVVQIGDEVTVRIRTTDNPGRIDLTLIAVRGVPVAALHRQHTPREVTGTKPDVQPSKDNRGVGGKQPRQPDSEWVNKGDARLPVWVRVWGGLWCVIIPGLICFLIHEAQTDGGYSDIGFFVIIFLLLAIQAFCIWVVKTLSIKGVPFRTKVGVVFKVIVAMLAAFTLFVLATLAIIAAGQ